MPGDRLPWRAISDVTSRSAMLILLRLAASLALCLGGCRSIRASRLLGLVALLLLLLTSHVAASARGLGFC